MRLLHKRLIPYLPNKQLLGQWRECCLIMKNITEKKTPNHILVNRIMDYPIEHFYSYCVLVSLEMACRKYNSDWSKIDGLELFDSVVPYSEVFEGWHNNRYLMQCYYNLQEKYDCGGISEDEWKRLEENFTWEEEDET